MLASQEISDPTTTTETSTASARSVFLSQDRDNIPPPLEDVSDGSDADDDDDADALSSPVSSQQQQYDGDDAMDTGVEATRGMKRTIENETPATKEPVSKKLKKVDRAAFYANVTKEVGKAPEAKDLASGGGGTTAFGIVVGRPDWREYKTTVGTEGGTFCVTTVSVLLGMCDPATKIDIDEATQEVVFTIPEPYKLAEAKKQKRETQSKKFIQIDETVEHRIKLYSVIRITVRDTKSLPGVVWPCVVRLEGLQCVGNLGNKGGVFYDVTAKEVVPVSAINKDPTAMCEFFRRIMDPETLWHEEMPYVTEEMVKSGQGSRVGRKPLCIPLVPMDNKELLGDLFPIGHDRGFFAGVRSQNTKPDMFFRVPKAVLDDVAAQHKAGKTNVKAPDPMAAGISNWKGFYISAAWDIVIHQWDSRKFPAMAGALEDPNKRQHYEFIGNAFATMGLSCMGVSHPQHWAIAYRHVRFMDGFSIWVEDCIGTSKGNVNIARRRIMDIARESNGPDDPQAIGLGHEMRQLPRMYCRGVMLDVRTYLRKFALRVNFADATVLMGYLPGDAENPKRALIYKSLHGEETVNVYRQNQPTPVSVKLDEDPVGHACLNMTQMYGCNLRKIDTEYTENGTYYVLTAIMPKQTRPDGEGDPVVYPNALEAAKWIPQIESAEALRICEEATKSPGDYERLKQEWRTANPERDPSKHAAFQYLDRCCLADWPETADSDDTTCLVYAIQKPPEAAIVMRNDKTIDQVVHAWKHGPMGSIGRNRPGMRIRNPKPRDAVDEEMDMMMESDTQRRPSSGE